MMNHWLLIVIAAGSNVALNLCLKKGGQSLDTGSLWRLVLSILSSGWMWLAVISAVALLTAFVAAIRIYSLSLTYTAVTALAMVTLTVVGALFQQEVINLTRVAGLSLIVAGLVVTAMAGNVG
ncbi:hypothetical protein J7376_13510 [Paracoccus sp. R12_1]|jgi:multidrug transporter EmrE-like cation transporter|uniref:hypothetical protein n=1 Tax=Paracoccus sp. TaxID=267 RepID=UPI000C0968A5|nr:hypothetical protein [Paracoccus sp. R12_2]MBO9487544.1 hypothetical protein [Paracoccus sp. R12_1]PHQ72048.1 MAG: hypothetical protein COB97_00450 [Paracoccus sp. (in: a-proteobacteria)]